MEFYNKTAKKYFDETVNIDMTFHYKMFLPYLEPNSKILDLGCGSGRDSKYFIDKGFDVDSIDNSSDLALLASIYIGKMVKTIDMKSIGYKNEYDGIWCSASLLHIMPNELEDVVERIENSLKKDGYLYISLKNGLNEVITDKYKKTVIYDELFIISILKLKNLKIKSVYYTDDLNGRNIKWLNIIAQK